MQIDTLERYLGNKTADEFYNDPVLKDACFARILVLGEYAGRTTQEFRERHSEKLSGRLLEVREIFTLMLMTHLTGQKFGKHYNRKYRY